MAARKKSAAKTWAEGRGKKSEREKTEERVRESIKPTGLRDSPTRVAQITSDSSAAARTVSGYVSRPPTMSSAPKVLHERAMKEHEHAAKQHITAAGGILEKHARDIAAARSETAHESGSAEDHFAAHKAHASAAALMTQRLAFLKEHVERIDAGKILPREGTVEAYREKKGAERDELQRRHDDHVARAEDHALLAGHGDMSKVTMVSDTPLEGADAKKGHEMIALHEEHVKEAVDHKMQASAHRAESKKEKPATGAAWDEAHPRDEHGRFISK